ncbi:flagellar hook-length control protein FliK [Proteus terrae]|uniref:flagellar hook-length control protein FliK n=1 Tax=Proteus terrae TaxID=1574161 RepID=UPI0013309109|nr:flagellar hook-length control protein FliK [Proteus terrae]QKD69069.1 flagellar hook-length control protein FliK [Proteus terrae subsp. cibarius]QKD74237.1 flagellar hook-length control protein FliK [Proteus terrae subsp. cibarius]UDF24650.1 flagellar hook-length control protein FliK [Proteus terrae subsp. cibarius]WCG85427.1 flagellar hook-length control protein FliK [Proteus terrae]
MEITLLTMDVAAASPGTTSASNSQPGDNAPTFAQLLGSQPQNAQSDKKTANITNPSTKENKAHSHSDEDKTKEDGSHLASVTTEPNVIEESSLEKSQLTLTLPDNEQFVAIVENKTPSLLMSAEELAAELPVQLAGLSGLKRLTLPSEQLTQALQQHQSVKQDEGLASLARTISKDNDMSDFNLTDKLNLSKSDEKSLLTQLRPETATLTTESTRVGANQTEKTSAKKGDSIATLLTPTAEKVNALLNGDKQVANAKLADNVAQQMVAGNRVVETDLHNTLSTSSSLASQSITGHAHSSTQPQMQFSPMATPVLNAQVGTQEWQQQLNQQIVMFSRNGLQKAELRLHPEELGSLHIRMKIEDGQAQLHLASQSGQVRSVLENAMHQLRQALSENGIQLTQSQVSSDTNDSWQQQNMSDSSQFSGDGADNHQGSEGNSLQLASETALQKITLTPQELASARGGVDIFA